MVQYAVYRARASVARAPADRLCRCIDRTRVPRVLFNYYTLEYLMMKAVFIRIGESRKMIHVSVTSGERGSVL